MLCQPFTKGEYFLSRPNTSRSKTNNSCFPASKIISPCGTTPLGGAECLYSVLGSTTHFCDLNSAFSLHLFLLNCYWMNITISITKRVSKTCEILKCISSKKRFKNKIDLSDAKNLETSWKLNYSFMSIFSHLNLLKKYVINKNPLNYMAFRISRIIHESLQNSIRL